MLLSKRGSKVVRGYVVCRGLFWHTHKILIQMFRRDPKRQVHPCYSACDGGPSTAASCVCLFRRDPKRQVHPCYSACDGGPSTAASCVCLFRRDPKRQVHPCYSACDGGPSTAASCVCLNNMRLYCTTWAGGPFSAEPQEVITYGAKPAICNIEVTCSLPFLQHHE